MKNASEYRLNRKFSQSFKDAIKGIWLCIRSERNMRIHTVCAVYVLFFARFFELSRAEFAILIVVIGIMISAEMFNTSIEKLCDFSCSKRDRRIGSVKDIAAGAVFVSSLIAVGVGFSLLFRPEKIAELCTLIFSSAFAIIALTASVFLSILFIIYGPAGFKNFFCRKRKNAKKGSHK
ncbi:MAG: diacylglycerol kinase family protein [Clostridia bacterium]